MADELQMSGSSDEMKCEEQEKEPAAPCMEDQKGSQKDEPSGGRTEDGEMEVTHHQSSSHEEDEEKKTDLDSADQGASLQSNDDDDGRHGGFDDDDGRHGGFDDDDGRHGGFDDDDGRHGGFDDDGRHGGFDDDDGRHGGFVMSGVHSCSCYWYYPNWGRVSIELSDRYRSSYTIHSHIKK